LVSKNSRSPRAISSLFELLEGADPDGRRNTGRSTDICTTSNGVAVVVSSPTLGVGCELAGGFVAVWLDEVWLDEVWLDEVWGDVGSCRVRVARARSVRRAREFNCFCLTKWAFLTAGDVTLAADRLDALRSFGSSPPAHTGANISTQPHSSATKPKADFANETTPFQLSSRTILFWRITRQRMRTWVMRWVFETGLTAGMNAAPHDPRLHDPRYVE
jgi:hypothetical protein